MESLWRFVIVLNLLVITCGKEIRISINGTEAIYNIDKKSPSVTLGMGIFKYGVIKYMNNTKLLTLAKALGPSYVRMGGTKSDHSHFVPGNIASEIREQNCLGKMPNNEEFVQHMLKVAEWQFENSFAKERYGLSDNNVSYTGSEFDDLMSLVNCANWELIFGLNLLDRKHGNKEWNSTNTVQLLNYAKSQKHRVNWELGNEPNSYHHHTGFSVTPREIATAFFQLNKILKSDSWWKQSKIIGPDANTMFKTSSLKFFKKVVHYMGSILNAVTFHQYYVDSRVATIFNFTDPALLNELLPQLKHVKEIVNRQSPDLPVWIGETSSSYGGGAKGLSDTYVAGFMWLDKLGLSASNGIDIVFRQTLVEGNYALLDDNFDPRPDYWLTLLYKTLVGTQVLNVTKTVIGAISKQHTKVRIYAHCTNTERTTYPTGSVTLYYLNLSTSRKKLSFVQQSEQNLTIAVTYILTSTPGVLNSSDIYLNNKKLRMVDIHTMPTFNPRQVNIGAGKKINLPPSSFGFIVLKDSKIKACLK
uniref:heparanase-like isoform X1 n=2 Tax=Styela clava TaxID=7725 RepID=UPI001939AAA9|nr:heparanase-like isoform X1 [Styela clava]